MNFKKYKLSTLEQKPHLFIDTIKLIEKSLGYASSNKFIIDFAPLMEKDNHKNCHIILDAQDHIIGHIGIKERIFGNLTSSTQVALIGGIAIKEECRGKGIFSYFFSHIESIYKKKNSMFILWSDLDELYKKYQFHQAGTVIESGSLNFLESELNDNFSKVNLNLLSQEDFSEILYIYQAEIENKYTTLKRNKRTWETIKAMSSAQFYIYKVDKKIRGYFFIEKGQDLKNIIHESACVPKYKKDFMSSLEKYKLWLPITDNYDSKVRRKKIFYSAIFKISNLDEFNQFFRSWSNNEAYVKKIKDGKVILEHKDSEFTVLESDFYTYLFGPSKIVEFEKYGKPLFFSGLDSI